MNIDRPKVDLEKLVINC